jgi:hypothetical protein
MGQGIGGASTSLVLQAVAERGDATMAEIHHFLRQRCRGEAADSFVAKLISDGLLVRLRGRKLRVTSKGMQFVPSRQPAFASGTYKPPAPPPRRAGSLDFLRLPSRVA